MEHSPVCNIMPVWLIFDTKCLHFKLGGDKIRCNCSDFLLLKAKWHSEIKNSGIQQRDHRNKHKQFHYEALYT